MYNQKLTEQLECNGFHIFLLYEAIAHQETNIQSAAVATRVVFCPEKFVMRLDMTKKRMKCRIEGTTTWIYGEKKKTFKNPRKGLGY